MRNASLWCHAASGRLFYYAEYAGDAPFEAAMARYAEMPRVAEWEAQMHALQRPLSRGGGGGDDGGGSGDGGAAAATVWWQPMECVFSSSF